MNSLSIEKLHISPSTFSSHNIPPVPMVNLSPLSYSAPTYTPGHWSIVGVFPNRDISPRYRLYKRWSFACPTARMYNESHAASELHSLGRYKRSFHCFLSSYRLSLSLSRNETCLFLTLHLSAIYLQTTLSLTRSFAIPTRWKAQASPFTNQSRDVNKHPAEWVAMQRQGSNDEWVVRAGGSRDDKPMGLSERKSKKYIHLYALKWESKRRRCIREWGWCGGSEFGESAGHTWAWVYPPSLSYRTLSLILGWMMATGDARDAHGGWCIIE